MKWDTISDDAEMETLNTFKFDAIPKFNSEYPFIAYKLFENKIVIINTAQDCPQKVIDLGQWMFVAFVNHS